MLRKNYDEMNAKGDWYFIDDDTFICLMFGDDKMKDIVTLPIDDRPNAWKWNGNREAPTLTPSILVHPYPGWTDGWHGYLTDGKLITV